MRVRVCGVKPYLATATSNLAEQNAVSTSSTPEQPSNVLMSSTPVKAHDITKSTSPLLTPVQEARDVLVMSDDSVEVHRKKTPISTNAVDIADLDDITQGRWLNDRVIHATQLLMKEDNNLLPVGGFQNPLLGQTAFNKQESEGVQILHSGGNHWITIFTVGAPHPHVRIYDSLGGVLSDDNKRQIASLLITGNKSFILEYANVHVSSITCQWMRSNIQILIIMYIIRLLFTLTCIIVHFNPCTVTM